jgi:hypothetical protein
MMISISDEKVARWIECDVGWVIQFCCVCRDTVTIEISLACPSVCDDDLAIAGSIHVACDDEANQSEIEI